MLQPAGDNAKDGYTGQQVPILQSRTRADNIIILSVSNGGWSRVNLAHIFTPHNQQTPKNVMKKCFASRSTTNEAMPCACFVL